MARIMERTEHRTTGHSPPPWTEHRPMVLWPLLVAMGFLSLGGFIGGVSFVADRTGTGLGAKLSWLEETPVDDFLLPGLFLLAVYAVCTAILMIGLAWRWSPGPGRHLDERLGFHWSCAGTMLLGTVLIAWIVYEYTIFQDRIVLQPILLGVGCLMIAIPLLPSMRRHYRTPTRG